uniref:Zinc-ribbon domain-containing protein n=1 Tax=Solibacter usitatus (strain Ellin6076) TaxID=234267 RepID=Q02B45_SOLUE
MPFCSQCGNQVAGADVYCGRCGAKQPVAGSPPPPPGSNPHDPFAALNPRTASILCYVPGIGWIASIIVLASNRFRYDRTVRFHGFQGLYLFVAWLLDDLVFRPLFYRIPNLHLYSVIQALLLGMSIFMMVKASHDEAYPLPLFGELAQKSVAED